MAARWAVNDEDPDENRIFTHEQIRDIIRNRELRARNDLMDLETLDRPTDGQEEPGLQIPGPILANVECCICQIERSNPVSDCGHLYCERCITYHIEVRLLPKGIRKNWSWAS